MGDDNTEPRSNQPGTPRQPEGLGRDQDTPNQAANKEPAEGSRENTNSGGAEPRPLD
jgi:hypothetical protein